MRGCVQAKANAARGTRCAANYKLNVLRKDTSMRVNYVAAVVSGIVYFIIQALWFTLFAAPWIAGLGWTPEHVEQVKTHMTAWPYALAFVCNVVMAIVLAKIIAWTGSTSAAGGARVGTLLWLGFVLTSMATEFAFERKPASFTLIAAGAVLVGLVLMGAIQGAWMARKTDVAVAVR
jgi:hypothetical protein